MFYNLLSTRAIQVGIVFFVLVVGGSLLYSWHAEQTTKAELAETQPIRQHAEPLSDTRTAPVDLATPGDVITPSKDTEPQRSAATDAAIDDSERFHETETLSLDEFFAEALPADAEVPEPADFKTTPDGYPMTPYWDLPADRQADWTYRDKLLDHVLVKLWREGHLNFDGGSMGENGQVHPHYTDTLYVEWEKWKHPDGTLRDVITHAFGASGIWQRPRGDPYALPPGHVNLIDLNSPEGQGIDPYTFLSSTELPE